MCLATVYRTEKADENIVMQNVQRIECRDGQVFLTDLFDRQVVLEGELMTADLVGGSAVVRERTPS